MCMLGGQSQSQGGPAAKSLANITKQTDTSGSSSPFGDSSSAQVHSWEGRSSCQLGPSGPSAADQTARLAGLQVQPAAQGASARFSGQQGLGLGLRRSGSRQRARSQFWLARRGKRPHRTACCWRSIQTSPG
jgi:hypothetical protein